MGHPGDRGISARNPSQGRIVSGRPHGARPLPLDLRRNALGIFGAAFVLADEPAHRGAGVAIWSAAQADIDRITEIWRECLGTWNGPWLFGRTPTVADAMYAPVVTRFRSYSVALDATCAAYCAQVWAWPDLAEWAAAARLEPEQIEELEVEF